jgi:hypothetical protein
MKPETIRAAAIAPVFLYVALITIARVGPSDPLELVAIAILVLPVFVMAWPGAGRWLLLPGAVLVAATAFATILTGGVPEGPWVPLAAGLLLASPLWFLGAILATRSSFGLTIISAIAGLGVALVLLSASVLPGADGGPAEFVAAVHTVVQNQLTQIAHLVMGTLPTAIPLSGSEDLLFATLSVLAFVGLLFAELAPDLSGERASPAIIPKGIGRPTAPFLRAIAGRTEPIPPPVAVRAGVAPLGAAALAIAVFLLLADALPEVAPTLIAIAVSGTLIVAFLRGRVQRNSRIPGGSPSTPSLR